MNELKVSNNTNFFNANTTTSIIKQTLNEISNSLARSLGPYGSTTIIQDKLMNHQITKDGYTILRNIKMDHPLCRTVLDVLLNISRNQVRNVGDGSTSAVLLASSLFQTLDNVNYRSTPSKDIMAILKIIELELIKHIKAAAIPVTDENLAEVTKKIAFISNNNDESMGELISQIYKDNGKFVSINIDTGYAQEDSFSAVSGMEVSRGLFHHIFINHETEKKCKFLKPLVFMCDHDLTEKDSDIVIEVIQKAIELGKPLVIIAKNYDTYMRSLLIGNKLQKKDLFQICPIDIAVNTTERLERFKDLAIYLGCSPYNRFDEKLGNIMTYFGSCHESIIGETDSKFLYGKGNQATILNRVKSLKEEIERIINSEEITYDKNDELLVLRRRIANLSNSMINLVVGGSNEIERNTRKYLFEDAVYACQSAIKHGYIIGGNLQPIFILESSDFTNIILTKVREEMPFLSDSNIAIDLINSVKSSFKDVYAMVLYNSSIDVDQVKTIINKCIKEQSIYNVKTKTYENSMEHIKIVNSAETDIQIIKSCFSIVGLLYTSNQFLAVNDGYSKLEFTI